MFSMTDLMKRAGAGAGGGGRLLAFFKAVCVYFVVGEGGAAPAAVAAKCAPVLCLLLIVLHRAAADHPAPDKHHSRRYRLLIACGLALSAAGDALLAVEARIEPGMAAFAAAHCAYLAAFGLRPAAPRTAALVGAAAAAYLPLLGTAGPLRALVPAYAALLAAMCWRGNARGGPAALGSTLFLLSDAALGYNMFVSPLPYHQTIVMSTYYLGQLGIALSALEPLERAH